MMPMLRRYNLGTLLLVAAVAELLASIAVVDWIGFGPAVLLYFGGAVLGVGRLRQAGMSALQRLRAMAEGRAAREDAFIDGVLSAIGAVLLILPGFLTDVVGLALLSPACRDWVRHRIGVGAAALVQRSPTPRTIDLETRDWSRIDRARPR